MARPLVGRESELRQLTVVLDDLATGRGGLVLLTGEPGIGKTRLAEELAARATAAGAEVHWATCWEGGGPPAYWPWVQLLAIAPDLGAGLPGSGVGEPRAEGDPDRARFALFEAVAALFRRAAARRPLVLVLDDLQWSDPSSLLLLRFVGRELRRIPVLLVGTYRDAEIDWDDEHGQLLADVAREALVLRLGGLDDDGVAELMSWDAPGGHRPELVTAVAQRSAGNPLFVIELARLLTDQDARRLISAPYEPAWLPPEIAAILQRRFALLAQPCHDLLSVAAVIGQDFGAGVLARVAGLSQAATLVALGEAVRAGIVAAPEPAGAACTFAHPLMRGVLYDQLGPARRAELHAAVGAVLEASDGVARAPAATLAYHFLRGGSGALAKGVRYSERAGRDALDALAYEEAARHFGEALEALERGDADPELAVELLLSLGDAQTRAGDLPAARSSFRDAGAQARQRGLAAPLARAALGLGTGPAGFEVSLFDDAQVELLEEALAALGAEDSPLRAWTVARLSVASSLVAPAEQRRSRAEQAVAMARRLGADDALAYALAAHCDAIAGAAHAETRLAEASEIVRLAEETGDGRTELLGRRLRLVASLELGDIGAVDVEVAAYARRAQSLRQPLFSWYVPLWRGMRALMAGRLAEAETRTGEAEAQGRQAHSANASMLAASQRISIALERGRPKEAEHHLRSLLDEGFPVGPGADAWLASICARDGRLAEAQAAVGRLVATGFPQHAEHDAEWLSSVCQLADACVTVGDVDAAAAIREGLAPFADRCAVDGIGAAWLGSTARYLGMLARVLGDTDGAVAHLEHALAVHRRAGAALLVAHTLHNLGDVLVARAGAGDPERAAALLAEAAAIYRELGTTVPEPVGTGTAAPARTSAEPMSAGNTFRREGETWTLSYRDRTVRVRDSKGLRDLARLLAVPNQEVLAAELLTAGHRTAAAAALSPVAADQHGLSVIGAGRGDPILDDRARREYRQRLVELRDELDEAERHHDGARADNARLERELITDELASSLGLGGRPRRSGDVAERARKAVTQRVRAAIHRLGRDHPDLGRHLDRSIRTGTYCSYAPERPTSWSL